MASTPCRQAKKRREEEEVDDIDIDDMDDGVKPLMRQWLIAQVGKFAGVEWVDEDQTLLKIPWMHGSSRKWEETECQLFAAWAKHSGKSNYLKKNEFKPNRLKANFRCAINSQVDIKEEKGQRISRGADACKVFRFLKRKLRRSEIKRRRTISGDVARTQHTRPRPVVKARSLPAPSPPILYEELDVDHEEEVETGQHSYSVLQKVDYDHIPTTVSQIEDEELRLSRSPISILSDDSAFSEISSEDHVPDDSLDPWIKSEDLETEVLTYFDEKALLASTATETAETVREGYYDEDYVLPDEEENLLTELIPVPSTNYSIAILS